MSIRYRRHGIMFQLLSGRRVIRKLSNASSQTFVQHKRMKCMDNLLCETARARSLVSLHTDLTRLGMLVYTIITVELLSRV